MKELMSLRCHHFCCPCCPPRCSGVARDMA